jgi:hypothetical protein
MLAPRPLSEDKAPHVMASSLALVARAREINDLASSIKTIRAAQTALRALRRWNLHREPGDQPRLPERPEARLQGKHISVRTMESVGNSSTLHQKVNAIAPTQIGHFIVGSKGDSQVNSSGFGQSNEHLA